MPETGPDQNQPIRMELWSREKVISYIALASVRGHSVTDQLHGIINSIALVVRGKGLEKTAGAELPEAAPHIEKMLEKGESLMAFMRESDRLLHRLRSDQRFDVPAGQVKELFEQAADDLKALSWSLTNYLIAVVPEDPGRAGVDPTAKPRRFDVEPSRIDPTSSDDRIRAVRDPMHNAWYIPKESDRLPPGDFKDSIENLILFRKDLNRGREIALVQAEFVGATLSETRMKAGDLLKELSRWCNAYFPGMAQVGFVDPMIRDPLYVNYMLLVRGVAEAVKNTRRQSPDAKVFLQAYAHTDTDPQEVEIAIVDNAGGVKPEHMELLTERDPSDGLQKIFKLYGSTKGGGIGLGELAEMVRMLGGRIEAANYTNGHGTGLKISILLPHFFDPTPSLDTAFRGPRE